MYLLLDRSSPVPAAILRDGGRTLSIKRGEACQIRQPLLGGELKAILSENGIAPGDLDCAVCGLGPGSFSGIRSVLCALIGLSLPFGKPLYGLSSAIACAIGAKKTGKISVVGDARRNRLWIVNYRISDDGAITLADGRVPTHTADDFMLIAPENLPEAVPEDAYVVSPDYSRLQTLLNGCFASRLKLADAAPDIEALATAFELLRESCPVDPAPIYLQPAVNTPSGPSK